MGILDILLPLALAYAIYLGAKVIWKAGFLAGTTHEALLWIASIDKLFVPNWQSLPVGKDEGLGPEALKFANQVYSAAYRAALDHIKVDIATIRREVIEAAAKAKELPGFDS